MLLALFIALGAAPAPARAVFFPDVPSDAWYATWVNQAAGKGLMSGYDAGPKQGQFGPDDTVTRAQVAMVLWRMAGSPTAPDSTFPDVPAGQWYTSAVAWCAKAGIVTGYQGGSDAGKFVPDRQVSRQELAVMAWRFAKWAGVDVSNPDPSAFKSTTDWRSVEGWASDALTWTAAAGVLSGVENPDGTRTVDPSGTATRAQAAKIFVVLSGRPSAPKASYTVTFESNGGSTVKAQTVANGGMATKPGNPTKSGYSFKGWHTDKGLTKAYDFGTAVKSNVTLYAGWTAVGDIHTVTFASNGGSVVKARAVVGGASVARPDDPTRVGYTFAGWYSDENLTQAYDFDSAVASDMVLYAKWEPDIVGYAVLYSDGLLSLQSGDDADSSHGKVLGSWAWDGSSRPWDDKRAYVKSVVVGDAISIRNGQALFCNLENCTSMDLAKLDVSKVTDFSYMFERCSSLESHDLSAWDVSSATNLSFMFSACSSLTSLNLSGWDVSSATDLSGMFSGCSSLSSFDVSGWDVSCVTSFSSMFSGCKGLEFLDLSDWDVSSAVYLSGMFSGCSNLASLDISGWGVSSAMNFSNMFSNCSALESLDLSGWDVSRAKDFSCMFSGCESLTSLNLSGWSPSSAADFSSMFSGCKSLALLDLSKWCPVSVTGLSSMFDGCSSLTSLDLSDWGVSKTVDLTEMFQSCSSLESLNLSGWSVPKATGITAMFNGCSALKSLDLSGWGVSKATDLSHMFSGLSSLESLDLSGWNPSSANNLSYMFYGCSSLESLGISDWDVSRATDLTGMFNGCSALLALDLSAWDVSGVTSFVSGSPDGGMFYGCSSLKTLDLSGWDFSSTTQLIGMFSGCSSLVSLGADGWNVSGVTSFGSGLYGGMFIGCSSLTALDLSGWDVSSATDLTNMFLGCESLTSLNLSGWDVSKVRSFSLGSAMQQNGMFSCCKSLTSLNLSGWDVTSADSFEYMFYDCLSLSEVTLGAGCGKLVGYLPSGHWCDAAGNSYYPTPSTALPGTFTRKVAAAQEASAEVALFDDVAPLADAAAGADESTGAGESSGADDPASSEVTFEPTEAPDASSPADSGQGDAAADSEQPSDAQATDGDASQTEPDASTEEPATSSDSADAVEFDGGEQATEEVVAASEPEEVPAGEAPLDAAA